MTFVYLLSDHEEYGAENVVATLDRAALPGLLRHHWGSGGADLGWLSHALAELTRHLERADEDLAVSRTGHNLGRGYGGVQLHVVRLE